MLFNIIWSGTALIILLTNYFQCKSMIKGNNNILIGITIPYLELKNEIVLKLAKEYEKENKILLLIEGLAFIPSFFMKMNSSQIIYLFLWIFASLYFSKKIFTKYNKKLMEVKRQNNWLLPSKYLVTIDTEVSRLKNKMPVSMLWFIPSIIISLIPILIALIEGYGSLGLISACTAFLGNIAFIIMYRMYSKGKPEVISEDSKVNIAYNTIFKRTWTAGTVIAATTQSVSMILMFLFLINIRNISTLFMLSVIFPPIVIVLGIFYINNKIKKEQYKIIKTCKNPIYADSDEYWSKGVYNNPNDRAVTVPDRAGYGMTYNLGTKKGRMIYYGTLIFSSALIVGVISMLVIFDYSKFTLSVNRDEIKINAPMYGIEFEADDIEDVTMVNNIPTGIRTNGVGASTYNLGNFSIDGYGKCKLYVYFENPNYVCIKMKNGSYIFINSKNNKETTYYYEELRKLNK